MTEPEDFKEELRTVVKEEFRADQAHPSAEDLVAFAQRELSEDRTSDLEEHLSLCRDCTVQVLALRKTLEEGEQPEVPGVRNSTEQALAGVKRRAAIPEDSAEQLTGIQTPDRSAGKGFLSLAKVAAVLVTAVGLFWIGADLLQRPDLVVDLEPIASLTTRNGTAGSEETARVPEGRDLGLRIYRRGIHLPEVLEVIFQDSQGREVLRRPVENREPALGLILLEIEAEALPADAWEIFLVPEGKREDQALGSYAMIVESKD
ncbi:MAG: hypothetical protein K0U98_05130 [Deltaproteobacteria bacterium]|nr:hypothetical protein [Deltaproteobacteria bacterium]